MAYTPMTAEQYVVAELQDAKDRIRMLKDNVVFLENCIDEANDLLRQLCKKMAIRNSEAVGRHIYFDTLPTEDEDKELFAKLKPMIENQGAD